MTVLAMVISTLLFFLQALKKPSALKMEAVYSSEI
jgi:hypothetical protein